MRNSSTLMLAPLLASLFLLSASCTSSTTAQDLDEATKQAIVARPTLENLPTLFEIVNDETHCFPKRSPSTLAVASLGKDAVPAILSRIEETRNSSWTSQVNYLYYLALIGPDAEGALERLNEIVAQDDTHRYIRHYAKTARAVIRNDSEEVARLATKERDFGFVALDILKARGADSRFAVVGLAETARQNSGQRRRYVEALEMIDSQAAAELRAEFAR